ncbi:MAG TPA: hypothetical protein VD948_06145 [Rhodothermales bacterium]|nr:hypothetical protein [Rhodothermales bacterium]
MASDLLLRRTLTFRAHGRKVVFVKRAGESAEHVVGKALLWALYLPQYPDLAVEVGIGHRYKPDVVALCPEGTPAFWGEAGVVSAVKVASLGRRFRDTHFAHATWRTSLPQAEAFVRAALGSTRRAPFDVLVFNLDDALALIEDDGTITATFADVPHVRIE